MAPITTTQPPQRKTLDTTETATGASSADALQSAREYFAMFLAIVVLLLSAWMLVQTYGAASSQNVDAFNRQKDILTYALSLLGTVMGYYFGRVPAELRAKQAETAAQANQRALTEAQQSLTSARTEALDMQREAERIKADVKRTLAPVLGPQAEAIFGVATAKDPQVLNLRAHLQNLVDRLG